MKHKVLIVLNAMDLGGIERSVLGLTDHIDYDEYDVDLRLFTVGGELLPYVDKRVNVLPQMKNAPALTLPIKQALLASPGVALSRLAAKASVNAAGRREGDASDFRLLQEYHRRCFKYLPEEKKEYDLLLSCSWPHYYSAFKVKAKKKLAFIHTDFTAVDADFAEDERVWSRFDRIAAVSDEVGAAFKSRFPALAGRVFTAENVMPVSLMKEQAKEEINDMPRAEGEKIILSVGRFCYPKAFDLAVKSARLMKDHGCRFRWYLIGFGPDEEAIRGEIKKQGVEDRFIILGKRPNPYPYFAACDIYAQPSRYEGKAVTVREAQFFAKPVLITDYATSASQIVDGVDGVICPQGPENVAKALEEMCADDALCARLSAECSKRDYTNRDAVGLIFG